MTSKIPTSSYTANIQTLVNSISFQSSVAEAIPPLNVSEISTNLLFASTNNNKTQRQWLSIFSRAAFFHGLDHKLDDVIVMVYEDPITKMISSVIFTVLGEFCFNGLKITESSRFFAAVENLKIKHRESNVRRAIAISLLKLYSLLNLTKINSKSLNRSTGRNEWDELAAGELASQMTTIIDIDPLDLGKRLLHSGFLSPTFIDSSLLDFVYTDDPNLISINNKIVFQMGEQLEKLFDPLTEYSPESTITPYIPPPSTSVNTTTTTEDDESINAICEELLHFQESITTQQIRFLTKVVTPLREKSLKGKIPIPIAELNEIFPPTIDEVTRMNCILLDSLQIAIKYGSFEMVKACGITIPFFFKAYMRHEAALKTFSHKLKGFLSNHERLLPSEYKRNKYVESILNVSLDLIKLKMVLERLIETKKWDIVQRPLIAQYFSKSVDIIDSFGRTTVPSYDRRIFTPSGKILTEICEDWPSELSNGWLRRKVVSVIESKHLDNDEDGVIIVFSDYVVFASVQKQAMASQVKIADIIMNSLINEEQLTVIPSLKVTAFASLENLQVYMFDDNKIKTLILNNPSLSSTYQVDDSSKFLTLLNKAKILGKNTPFHLFKDKRFGFSVAHEISTYSNESLTSNVVVFLNKKVDRSLLEEFDMFAAMFVNLKEDENIVSVSCITIESEEESEDFIELTQLSQHIFETFSHLEIKRNSSIFSDIFDSTIKANKKTLNSIAVSKSPTLKSKTFLHSYEQKPLPTPNTDSQISNGSVQQGSLFMEDLGFQTPERTKASSKQNIILKLSEGVKHIDTRDHRNWKLKPINFNSSDDDEEQEESEDNENMKALRDFEATMVPLYDPEHTSENWGISESARDIDSPMKTN